VNPEYQVGNGCLADQLIGQYLADVAGLGPLVSPANVRKTLASLYRYNYHRTLVNHDTVQRTYALNDEAALVICDYGKAERPRIPFPYYAEAWSGIEYLVGSHMMFAGMVREGVEFYRNVRLRHDGEKRNPWDEPECGHHYARAMSAWSGVLAMSGFRYRGEEQAVEINAPAGHRCLWTTGTGWGTFNVSTTGATIRVAHGTLPVHTCIVNRKKSSPEKTLQAGEQLQV
jgi:non-lysosomal glucosylceramidase